MRLMHQEVAWTMAKSGPGRPILGHNHTVACVSPSTPQRHGPDSWEVPEDVGEVVDLDQVDVCQIVEPV